MGLVELDFSEPISQPPNLIVIRGTELVILRLKLFTVRLL